MYTAVDKHRTRLFNYCYLKSYSNKQLKFVCMRAVRRCGIENGRKDRLYREMYEKYCEYLNLAQQGLRVCTVDDDLNFHFPYPESFYDTVSGHKNPGVSFETFKSYILKQKGIERKQKKTPVKRSAESLSRTRSKVFELSLCNSFEYFFTLTFNPEKFNRANLKDCYSKVANYIKNYNNRKDADIKYLLIPERHEDGSWHFHGLMKNVPFELLHEFTPADWDLSKGKRLPHRLIKSVKSGKKVYHWEYMTANFGWNTLEDVQSVMRVSKYITKYITKSMSDSLSSEPDAHLYYCSKGLARSRLCKQGFLIPQNFVRVIQDSPGFYASEYCCSFTADYSVDMLETLSDCISEHKECSSTGYSWDGATADYPSGLTICKQSDTVYKPDDDTYKSSVGYLMHEYIQKYPEIAGDFERSESFEKLLYVSDGQVQVRKEYRQDYTDFIDRIYPPVQLKLLE